MNILVLGGNGYLGSKISNLFSKENRVYCTIRTGEGLNLLQVNNNISIINSETESVKKIIDEEKIDVLINTVCCYEKSKTELLPVIEANLIYSVSIIGYAIEHDVRKILTIDTSLPENVNLYSLTKKAVAKIGEYYTTTYDNITFFNILLENFYGEDEPKNRFLHQTICKLKNNEEIKLTEGLQRRDFIYVEDVLSAINLLVTGIDERGFINVPIGTGEGPTIREVVEYLKEVTNSKSQLLFGAIPSRKNEPSCIANLEYLKKHGYVLKYPYKKGLKKLV